MRSMGPGVRLKEIVMADNGVWGSRMERRRWQHGAAAPLFSSHFVFLSIISLSDYIYNIIYNNILYIIYYITIYII